jgi:hypothetical protein
MSHAQYFSVAKDQRDLKTVGKIYALQGLKRFKEKDYVKAIKPVDLAMVDLASNLRSLLKSQIC